MLLYCFIPWSSHISMDGGGEKLISIIIEFGKSWCLTITSKMTLAIPGTLIFTPVVDDN